jgi:hypothetical protein
LIPNLSEVDVRSYFIDDVIATTAKLWQEETSTDPDWKQNKTKVSIKIELTTKLA